MTREKKIFGRTIEVRDVEELQKQERTTKILDVRTSSEYNAVHIPGSYNIPLDQLLTHCIELANTLQSPIILVCRSGTRAEQAALFFDGTNLAQFHVLRGGIQTWEQSGNTLNRSKQRWNMERQFRGVAGSVVLLSIVGALFVWKPFALLAGCVGGGLAYSALTDTCGMAMLLSKLPYNRSVASDVRDVVKQLRAAEEKERLRAAL